MDAAGACFPPAMRRARHGSASAERSVGYVQPLSFGSSIPSVAAVDPTGAGIIDLHGPSAPKSGLFARSFFVKRQAEPLLKV